MAESKYRLVLDAGTTGVKALVFDGEERVLAKSHRDLRKHSPQPGWVEQDPWEILAAAMQVMRDVLQTSGVAGADIAGLGIATQRETVMAWDKMTGEPVYAAIVWQDERTQAWCAGRSGEDQDLVRQKTGLPIEAYFSASKMAWILAHVPQAKQLANQGQLCMGTVDSCLLWNFIGEHVTDYTNASRTLLFNIKTLQWDEGLLALFGVPTTVLPKVMPSVARYGFLKKDILGMEVPVMAVCGDQQASLYAAGTAAGTTKVTYGTGTFVMQILGADFALHEPWFTTLAVGERQPWYALEAKATSGVNNADEILHQPQLLQQHIEELVRSAQAYVEQLPTKPKEIVIDGGWIRDKKILPLQSKLANVPVREQIIFDGTALGMARMVQAGQAGV
jgi:glycerol kinase